MMRNSNPFPEISDFLIACANSALFPLASFSPRVMEEASFAAVLKHHFEKRAYQLRHPVAGDLSGLMELEAACWPGPLRMSAEELRGRIERYPAGHCVMDWGGRLAGAIHSQRIGAVEPLKTAVCTNVAALHRKDGPIVQLLSIAVLPEMQHLGLGDQLLEFMLQYASVLEGVERIVAVSLCREYALHDSIPPEEYIRLRDESGFLKDPILRFHESHGGRITGLCPGYRPGDSDNRGNGVLVEYDIRNRHSGNARTEAAPSVASPWKGGPVLPLIEKCVAEVMGEKTPRSFSPSRPLMEMGFDSLKLMALRSLLAGRLGRELDSSFFFRHPTPEKIARFFEDGGSGEARPAISVKRSFRAASDIAEHTPEIRATGSVAEFPENAMAIVGMACRFPGGVESPADYWKLLAGGTDAITEIPKDRWDMDRYFDPDPEKTGKIMSRHGGFIREVDRFDAAFFNISPREAAGMDPQQRLLLTLTWEALEDAGMNPAAQSGTRTGVFVGLFSHDYETLQIQGNGRKDFDSYFATGNSAAVAAGRLSYCFGFQGPALAVDTACSASLVAVHLACRSLRLGETDLAIAAGVNLLLSPELSITFSRAGMLSPDGRCKTFDASADGYVRSEGCGVVVLKRLSEAIADGDPVLAVLRGSAVNQDGASNGLTAPNGLSQEAVIRTALADAGVPPSAVSYVEAHGTGTSLGDPVEVSSIANVYGQGRDGDNPLIIGSVKANIGHTEAAAGMAGLIKVILAMCHRHLPMQPNFRKLNPLICLDTIPARIPVAGIDWKTRSGSRLLAGVSAFGFSGTNAHIVVEEAPEVSAVRTNTPERSLHLLTLSAKSASALTRLSEKYVAFLDESVPEERLADICHTANAGRTHFNQRIGIVGGSVREMREKLRSSDGSGNPKGGFRGSVLSPPQVAFLFTGQGSQFAGMAGQLYHTQPAFRSALDHCGSLLKTLLDRPLINLLYPEQQDSRAWVDQTVYTQPALFAVEYALCHLWKCWGVEPGAVLGHSVGEYAAACAAGVFSLEDGLKLIAARGRLMQALPRNGAMAAVFAEEAVVADAIASYKNEISVAAVNGPLLIVISGLTAPVERVTRDLESKGVKVAMLNVSHAFHSPLMDPMLDAFGKIAREISFGPPAMDLISNLTGESIGSAILSSDYWMKHVRAPVRFAAGMEALYRKGYRVFVEIGPHPVLAGMAKAVLPDSACAWLPSLQRGRPDWEQLLGSLGELYAKGARIDWQGLDADYPRRKTRLPTYPFEGRRYWIGPSRTDGKEILETAPVDVGRTAGRDPERLNDLLYRVEWCQQALAPHPASAGLPSPMRLRDRILEIAEPGIQAPPDLLAGMEALSFSYVRETLHRLGWDFPVGARFTTADAAVALRVAEKYRRLFGRLLGMLAEEGVLHRNAQGWEAMESLAGAGMRACPSRVHPEMAGKGRHGDQPLQTIYPQAAAELTLLGRCGEGLAGVLRGETDPLGLLFPEADLTMAERLYEDSLTFGAMNRMVGAVMAAILPDQTGDRKLRILEIGAGTGGTSAAVLPHLTGRPVDYVFTDVSAHFLTRARQRFADYPFMRFQLLDIEKDPVGQGCVPHQYDVILAANVIHATADLRYTLQQVGRLLSPGGMVVLLEGIERRRWLDMIFGLLDGWWKFKDFDLRPSHPLMGVTAWEKLLKESGFSETAAISPGHGGLFDQAILLGRALPETQPFEMSEPRHWLVFSDTTGVGASLSDLLAARGDIVTQAFTGGRFDKNPDGQYSVNPLERMDFHRLLRAAGAEKPALHGIIHLWSLDSPVLEAGAGNDVGAASLLLCTGMLHLVQALIEMDGSMRPSLWLVTSGAVSGEGTEGLLSGLSSAPLWGMAQVIAAEHPELNCVRIDIDRGQDCVSSLFEEILQEHSDDRIALRKNARYSARLTPFKIEDGGDIGPVALHSADTYLISGGTGGTGLRIAEHLVGRGAGQVVLLNRSGKPADGSPASKAIRELERAGAHIVVARADVSKKEEVEAVLTAIRLSRMPLKGIIHAAGIFEDRLIANHEAELFRRVFAAKISGAWNLHELTKDLPLDFFVLFSSATSFVCSSGLANYVAGNTFLDALAHYRRSIGLPGLSIDWGPWQKTGMAEAVDRRRPESAFGRWGKHGLDTLAPEKALSLFGQLLGSAEPQVLAMPMAWQRFFSQQADGAVSSFFERIPDRKLVCGAITQDIYGKLKAATADQWRDLLSEHIRFLVAGILGLNPPAAVDVHQGFFRMGMDSLTSMALRNRLQQEFSCTLAATLVFKYPTVASLSEHLIEAVVKPAIGPAADRQPQNGQQPADGFLAKPAAIAQKKSEPIAVIGMGCRFPGGADSPARFWNLLENGADAIIDLPGDRWDMNAYYDADPDAPGKMTLRNGGFLTGIDRFDASFFGISPREAACMDPQHRLILEVGWEALENAGVAPTGLKGSSTGVFVGIGQNDYAQRKLNGPEKARIDTYDGTGNLHCFAAGRLAYALDLRGPNMAIDTACSSSLVAIHQACQSLRAGDCDLALAGGVHLIISPEITIFLSRAHVLSSDGRCKTFDAAADGFSRGEGCGMIVLKRLSDAVADRDTILALIRGSAINHDGTSSGLTVPNERAQEALIRQALQNADIDPHRVSYVEAHGTGTALGDPIEVNALAASLCKGRTAGDPLMIGSVKTNMGHLEAAAGIAGVIKLILSLQHQWIPPHLHFKVPNPHIDWKELPIEVVARGRAWLPSQGSRIGGVSSFGFSGTNAHIVFSEAPEAPSAAPEDMSGVPHLLTLSAKSDAALRSLCLSYEAHLSAHSEQGIGDICFTANTGRSAFDKRLAIIAETGNELRKLLAAFGENRAAAGLYTQTPQRDGGAFSEAREPVLRFETPVFPVELAKDYVGGGTPSWRDYYRGSDFRKVALPTYPFQRQPYWVEDGGRRTSKGAPKTGLPCGRRVILPFSREVRFENRLSESAPAHLADHRLFGAVVVSAASQIAMVLASVEAAFGTKTCQIGNMVFSQPLLISEKAEKRVQLIFLPAEPGTLTFRLVSDGSVPEETDASWTTHSSGTVGIGPMDETAPPMPDFDPDRFRSPIGRILLGDEFYAAQHQSGYQFGPSFRWAERIWPGETETLCQMTSRITGGEEYAFPPGLLDTCFQMIGGFGKTESEEDHLLVPVRIGNLKVYRKPSSGGLWCVAKKDTNNGKDAASLLSGSFRLMDEKGAVLVAVEGFQLEKAPREVFLPRMSPTFGGALYEVNWRPAGSGDFRISETERESGKGAWLLFADQTGFAAELAERLRARGEAVCWVARETRYAAVAADRYDVNPEVPGDFGRLFRAIGKPLKGMIFLWGLDLGQTVDAEAILQAEMVCGGVSAAVRAAGELESGQPGPLWVITRGAQPVGTGAVSALQAMLWGIGAVLDVEHPELCTRCVDLPSSGTGTGVPMLLEALFRPDAENRIALRPEGRYTARLERRAEAPVRGFRFDADAGYLITGGLGDLGLAVADWMARNGAAHLMLTGRSGPTGLAAEKIARIERTGCKAMMFCADVSNQEEVKRLMNEIDLRMPPLRGIVHAAGITDDAVISRLERERFRSVMAPKVRGTWNLHAATAEKPLDFFVCFSSAAAIMGAGGQANYAAANAFMDAFNHERRRQGLRGLSVNWGAWGSIGMAARMKADVRERMAAQGMGDIAPEQGLQLLGDLLQGDTTQALVMTVAWDRYLANRYPKAPPPFFDAVVEKSAPGKPADVAGWLHRTPAGERQARLFEYVRSQVAATLGMTFPEQLEPRQRLFDIGMDSLMAVELKNRLESGLGISLRSTLVFDYPTLEAMATYLCEEGLPPFFPSAISDEAERAPIAPIGEEDDIASLLSKIEAMSDQKLQAMFKSRKSKPAGNV